MIDNTDVKSCLPGSGPCGNYTTQSCRFTAHHFQRDFHSGYFRGNGIKFQIVVFLNGYNNCGNLNMASLVNYIYSGLEPSSPGHLPRRLWDNIFVESTVIVSTQTYYNTSRSEKRLMIILISVR